jgi:hypothetical protein
MSDDAARAFDTARKDWGFMFVNAPEGLRVGMVFPARRAWGAGLQLSDEVIGVDGSPVSSLQDLADVLAQLDIDQSFSMEVSRSGEKLRLLFPSKTSHHEDLVSVEKARQENPLSRVLLQSCQLANTDRSSGEGTLRTIPGGLEFVARNGGRSFIPWKEVKDIQVATSATSRVTITRIFLIGLFALAAQKKQLFTVLEVETDFTTFGFVTVEPQSTVVEVVKPLLAALRSSRATALQPALPVVGEPVAGQIADSVALVGVQPVGQSIAEQIRELAGLRDEGLISDEEFSLTKSRILGI